MVEFHDKSFDAGTKRKLELFRGYLREWIPVFLTASPHRPNCTRVNIYDFFAGPGRDTEGNAGSPLIVVDELRQYCQHNRELKAPGIDVRIHFNDKEADHIEQLRKATAELSCPEECCRISFSALPFQDAFDQHLPDIQHPGSANLVIMDQCGVEEVTPDVLRGLAQCRTTDVLFFIASAFIRRFPEQFRIADELQIPSDEISATDYNKIHRHICDFYRGHLLDLAYYLAPFSIKKGSNIYGVIFGSGHLRGLEKFLKVCWKQDEVTGEANFNIDRDPSWHGQLSIFEEENVIRKMDQFSHDLKTYIANESPNNRDLYAFSLTHGFLARHAREILSKLRSSGALSIVPLPGEPQPRSGAYYLNLDPPRVKFNLAATQ